MLINTFLKHSVVIIFFLINYLCLPLYSLIPSAVYAGSLELNPAMGAYHLNDRFTTSVVVDTQGINSSGVDLKINFDASILELLDIQKGKIYDTFLGKTINNQTGEAYISGIVSSKTKLFKGRDNFVILKWKAKKTGLAQVSFLFSPGNNNDSNIADFDNQKDSLTRIVNGIYTIDNGKNGPGNINSPLTSSGKVKGLATEKSPEKPLNTVYLPLILIISFLILISLTFFLIKHRRKNNLTLQTPLK